MADDREMPENEDRIPAQSQEKSAAKDHKEKPEDAHRFRDWASI